MRAKVLNLIILDAMAGRVGWTATAQRCHMPTHFCGLVRKSGGRSIILVVVSQRVRLTPGFVTGHTAGQHWGVPRC